MVTIPPLQKYWSSQENVDVSKVDEKRKQIKMHHSVSLVVPLEVSQPFEMVVNEVATPFTAQH